MTQSYYVTHDGFVMGTFRKRGEPLLLHPRQAVFLESDQRISKSDPTAVPPAPELPVAADVAPPIPAPTEPARKGRRPWESQEPADAATSEPGSTQPQASS